MDRIGADFLERGGEMGARIRAYDWAASPLGPSADWPHSLRAAIRILLSSRFAMWMAWGDRLTFFCNDAYAPTLGVKESWALGAPADEVWAEIWPDIGPRIRHVLETGEATWDEHLLLFLKRSGFAEETYHTFSYSPLADDDGRITGMLCVVTEETDRVIGERRLATLAGLSARVSAAGGESEVLAAAQAALTANDKDLPFAALYMFDEQGACARRVAGADSPVTPPTIEAEAFAEAARRCREGSGRGVIELPAEPGVPCGAWGEPPRQAVIAPIAQQGREQPAGFLLAGLNPFRTPDRAYLDFVDLIAGQLAAGIANARAYEAERARAEALAQIDEAKTRFFSNVSHEFRTPLTLMLGPLEEVLQRGEASPGVVAEVETAHRNGLRLLRLVNNLLDFSRIEAGRAHARFEPTELGDYVVELTSTFRSATNRAGLYLDVRCADLGEQVWVDRDMIEKIVLNLVSNAFKFTLHGGITVTVDRGPGRTVELSIADTGVGVPEAELPRLFERFHRVEGTKGRSYEGTGIGLALVQELVRLHGGSVEVESAPGAGTRFTVRLRLGADHLPAEHRVETASPDAQASPKARAFVEEALRWLPDSPAPDVEPAAPEDGAVGRGRRILLVDDNADMRAYLARLLRQQGYAVSAAPDGKAALQQIRAVRPDLVLSDVMMPVMDGLALLAAIRADPALADLPAVLLSARAGEEASVEGMAAGADDYLTKPFSARELLARIGANLALAGARRTAAEAAQARAAELQAVLDTAPVGVWFTEDREGRTVSANAVAERLLRMEAGANATLTPAPGAPPPHFRILRGGLQAEPASLPLQRAARGEEVRDEEVEVVFDDGSRRDLLLNATPLRTPDGAIRGAVCAAIDITERKRAEEHRQLLINELNHRVKNTLATVQSVALQTLRSATDVEAFRESFEARLMALARAHDILTAESWEGANLRGLAEQVLGAYLAASSSSRVELVGGATWLPPRQALAIAMALHELATNAVKYGALSSPIGRVVVEWRLEGEGTERRLALAWREQGGPVVRRPTRQGFGSRLLQRGLARELEGKVTIRYEPPGVVCVIEAPAPGPIRPGATVDLAPA